MKEFLQWNGWMAISSICQILMALFALIAICITIKQISSKSNPNLHMSLEFGLGVMKSDKAMKVVPGFSIHIANLGIAPVYISQCGIEFFQGKTSKSGLFLTDNPFVLQPGECVIKGMSNFEALIPKLDCEVSPNDKARMYVKSQVGKTIYRKIGLDYAGFKHEFKKVVGCAEESNTKNLMK